MKTYFLICLLVIGQTCLQCNAQPASTKPETNKKAPYTFGNPSRDGIGKFFFGREISQVMGAGGTAWLERDERDEEEKAGLAIKKMPIQPGSVVADIGAGTGYFSFKIAQRITSGKVFAVEIQEEMIEYLQQKKLALKDSLVEIIRSTPTSANLPPVSIDLAIMVDVYHELEFPQEMLQSILKSLKPGGKLLLIEYRGEDPSIPIKPLHKTTVWQLKKELGANGFRLSSQQHFLPLQHFLLFEKQPNP